MCYFENLSFCIISTYRFKKNRTHCFPSKIRTVRISGNDIPSMHGIPYQFHHHIFKIVEMRAVWKKKGEKSGFCEKVACTGWLFESETILFFHISITNWDIIKYHSLKEAETYGILFGTRVEYIRSLLFSQLALE